MGSLFDIVNEFKDLYEIATSDPDSQIFEDTLEALTGDLEAKSANYVAVIQQLEMEADKAEELEKHFKEQKEMRDNAVKRMKARLLYAMTELDKKEIAAGNFTIKIQNNGGKLKMNLREEEVPDNYRMVVLQPDKDKIRKALESGATLSFAELEPRGKHIVIK
jgi:hypothetical protein